jgi:hypothetical protein
MDDAAQKGQDGLGASAPGLGFEMGLWDLRSVGRRERAGVVGEDHPPPEHRVTARLRCSRTFCHGRPQASSASFGWFGEELLRLGWF